MGLRQTLNEKPVIAYALAGLAAVLAIAVAIWSFSGNTASPPDTEFFSVDDGQTFFRAPISNIPPFEHEGQTAHRAAVYECDGEQFVGYLIRYKPEIREELAAAAAKGEAPDVGLGMRAERSGKEFKKPGEGEWFDSTQAEGYARVTTVTCPGGAGTPRPVFP